jgi:hypothetical protein
MNVQGNSLQAIQAALDKNATIISMSWAVSMKEGEDGSKKKCELFQPKP